MDTALLSSPDPLNDSATFEHAPRTRRSSRARQSVPFRSSSPTKQTFELDVGNRLSPQKLLVTVEAGSDGVNSYNYLPRGLSSSPCRAPKDLRRERTTTTTIPVKGLSDTEDEFQDRPTTKTGRGRPRKSLGTPVPLEKGRSSTPARRKSSTRRSIGDLVDGDDENDVDFQIGKDVAIGRGKGRSRSRSTKGASRKSTPAPKNVEVDDALLSTTSRKGRGRRKTLVPEEVVVHEDNQSSGGIGEPHDNDVGGALQPIDANGTLTPYSTIRSTTTIGWGEPDVVARFGLEDETPQKAGWSSPRALGEVLPSARVSRSYQSPSISSDNLAPNHDKDESVAMLPELGSDSHSAVELNNSEEGDDYVDQDQVEDMPEFDTILESEGFSMISVDSVPSLRERLSSPAGPTDEMPQLPVGHRNIGALMKSGLHEDSFSSIPENVLLAATPAKKTGHALLSVPHSHINDSFSSIPPDILEAATPARKTQLSKLKLAKISMDDSFSSIPPDVLEAATPARRIPKNAAPASQLLQSEPLNDSISLIRSTIIDAPASSRSQVAPQERTSMAQAPLASPRPGLGAASSYPTSRLLTPEETPSPGKDDEDSSNSDAQSQTQSSTTADSLTTHSQIPSSPPSVVPRRYTYTAHLRRQSQLHPNITQTPSIVFSSPSLPPPLNLSKAQNFVSSQLEQKQRLAISPAARAGQALQNIAIPLSPRARSQSLGSPFKSPVSDRKSSPNDARDVYPSPSHDRSIRNLPKIDLRDNFSQGSSHEKERTRSTHHDDPFRNSTVVQRSSPTSEEKRRYILEMPQKRLDSSSQSAALRATPKDFLSEDEMSWQAESEVSALAGRISTGQREITSTNTATRAIEQQWASERAAVSREIASASSNEVILIDSDEENVLSENDEDLGLLLETINSSSPVASQTQENQREFVEKPRRSKIPSPWRKNSKRLVYSDELSRLSCPDTVTQPLRKELGNVVHAQPATDYRAERSALQLSDEVDPDLSGWHVPQKANFNPKPRTSGNLDLSALLASSPAKQLPVLSSSSQSQSVTLPLSSPIAPAERYTAQPEIEARQYGFQEEQKKFEAIPQKADFNPRPSGSSPVKQRTPGSGLFVSPSNTHQPQSYVQPYSPKSPEVHESSNLANTDALLCQDSPLADTSPATSFDGQSHSPNTNQKDIDTDSRTLKWTQSLQLSSHSLQTPGPLAGPISPTKSCLRTPLKPSFEAIHSINTSPSKNVQFASSSPIPSPSQEMLSPNTWSKAHWLLLNSIWNSHRASQNPSPSSNSTSNSGSNTESTKKRRNSTRVVSKLLGRKVFSRGEEMILEQWHLEIVDEFRGKVPGWEEKVIAMRVFSLIVGEKRRELGLPPPKK